MPRWSTNRRSSSLARGEQHPAADVAAAGARPRRAGRRSPSPSRRRASAGCNVVAPRSTRANNAGSMGWEKTSIGTSTSTGPGWPLSARQERLVDDLGEQLCPVDPPGALDERPIDLELRSIGVEVDFLMRVAAEVVRRHVAGDDDHRDAVEGGVGDAGCRVGEPGAEVAEDHRGATGDPGVAVGGMGGDLFVAHVDELDGARRPSPRARRCWCARTSPKTWRTPRRSRWATSCSAAVG